jgi:hypothetical protein
MWYVYVDWTTEDKPRPYYVGKGDAQRLKVMFRNTLHENIKRKHGFNRQVVFETNDEIAALDLETKLIAEYRTYAHGGDGYWGANFTIGGDGVSGMRHNQEVRSRISAALRLRSISDETRQKIGEKHRGKLVKDETRQAIKASVKLRWENLSEEQRQAYRDARNRNRLPDSIETRQKRSESMKLWHARQRGEVL